MSSPIRSSTRSRAWCFTLNNYTDADVAFLKSLDTKYIVFGYEVSPTTSTPHLQGYVMFATQRTLKSVSKLIPRSHLTPAKGSGLQNQTYCIKSGTFYENGTLPLDPSTVNVDRWKVALDAAKSGDLDSIPNDLRLRYYRTFKEIKKDYAKAPPTLDTLEHEWHHGPPGKGKSRGVRESNPSCYIKVHNNKWFDGYQDEPVVLIDDLDKYDVSMAGYLKIWADHYPFQAETKGGSLLIRPNKIIVTSNYSIDEIWEDSVTREALHRRFKSHSYHSIF